MLNCAMRSLDWCYGGNFVQCLALWDRGSFSFSSSEVWLVITSLSEAKAGDNGVLPSQIVSIDLQLQWR